MNRKKMSLLTKGGIVLFLVILSALVLAGRRNLSELNHLREVKRSLIEETLKLVEENKRLREERDNLSDPNYIREASRKTLGVVKADETVYVVGE